MAGGHTVVDTDAHYLEAIDELATYFDEDDPWRMRLQEEPGKMTPSNTPDHYMYGRIQRDHVGYLDGKMTPEEVPAAMEHLGIDKIVMLSHTAIGVARIGAEDDRPYVLSRGYMEYMLDRVVDPAEGIYTAIPIPHQDPGDALDLIDAYGDEPGVVGLCLITKGPEPPLGHRRYEPVYEVAERKGLPVIFHAGGSSLDDFYVSGFERFIETHSLGFLWSVMAQVTSVVMQGIPEKFPGLDFVFQEAGVTWVAGYMGRLDAEYLKRRAEVPLLEQRPSEYLKEFYYGIQPLDHPFDPDYFEAAVEAIGGADSLMYASDYPHWDYDPPSSVTDIPFLSADEKAQVLGGNAEAVFGL
jgi:predicted TIM-barrel fold metal-dependent hydrolase